MEFVSLAKKFANSQDIIASGGIKVLLELASITWDEGTQHALK